MFPGHSQALQFAQLALLAPPGARAASLRKGAKAIANAERLGRLVERHELRGPVHLRAVLPIEFCPRMNELLRLHFGAASSLKEKTIKAIFQQNRCQQWAKPITGRPLVRFVRFTTKAPDDDSSWTKSPLDVLTTGIRGGGPHHLGVVEDDNREAIELRAWWEPSVPNMQFVYLDVSGGVL